MSSVSQYKINFILLLAALPIWMFAQDPGLTFGGPDNDAGFSICLTEGDGYLLAGSSRSFGAGSWSMYAAKITHQGNTEWTETYGWEHQDHFYSVIPLPDGYLFSGYAWDYGNAREDVYLLKTDLSGNRIFDKLYGTHLLDIGFRIYPADQGGFFLLGYTRGYEPHGDIFLLRIDEQGNELWRNHYGTTYDDYAYSLVELSDGSVMIFGSLGSFNHDVHYNFKKESADWMLIRTDSEGTETWRKTFSGPGHDFAREIIKAPQDGYYLFGSTMSEGAGSFDMLLMRVDETGNESWKKTFGGPEYDYGMSMDVNADGDLFLAGTTKSFGQQGSPDFFVVKTDAEGETIWDLTIGGNDLDFGQQVVATTDGGCAIIGMTRSFGAGGSDMMMAKVSADGMIEQLINGIDTSTNEQWVIYPNPARGNVRVKTTAAHSDYTMEIVSLQGISFKSYILRPPDYRFNVDPLPAGIYVYRISKEGSKDTRIQGKLVIR